MANHMIKLIASLEWGEIKVCSSSVQIHILHILSPNKFTKKYYSFDHGSLTLRKIFM